jgi:hypothetical protein
MAQSTEELRQKKKDYYQRTKEHRKEYCKEHFEERKANNREYIRRLRLDPARWNVFRERQKINGKNFRERTKYRIFNLYSGGEPKCAQCGENRMVCLSIDHIQGDGAKHRRELNGGRGTELYLSIEKNYDPSRFQVLCMNCQWVKRANRDETH